MTAIDKVKASGIAGGFAGMLAGSLREYKLPLSSFWIRLLTLAKGDGQTSFPG